MWISNPNRVWIRKFPQSQAKYKFTAKLAKKLKRPKDRQKEIHKELTREINKEKYR